VFLCVRGTKRRLGIFHAAVGPMRVAQEARMDTLL